jgi:hypothetical protein
MTMSIWSLAATIVLALLGALCTWAFFVAHATERAIARDGHTVVGTVIDRVDCGGDGYHLQVAYTIDGVNYEMRSDQPQVEDVGTKIEIRYLPGKPLEPRLQLGRLEPWHGTIGSIAGAVIFGGGAIATAVLGMKGVF